MITRFRSALNKVKAEDDLIKKTSDHLQNKLNRRKTIPLRRAIAAAIAVIFLSGTFAFGAYLYKTPVAYVSLDINPSVEVGLNVFNKIVEVKGMNSDGQLIIEVSDILGDDLENAIRELVEAAADNDYIKENGTTVISVTGESNNPEKAALLSEISEQAANTILNEKNIKAILYKDNTNLSLKSEAEELGISLGKYKLIKTLQTIDPSITEDQLKDMPVSEIMLMANRLIEDETDAEDEDVPDPVDEDKEDDPEDENEDADRDDDKDDEENEAEEKLKEAAKEAKEKMNEAILDEFENLKKEAESKFEEAKSQSEEMKQEAKEEADRLRKEADALLKDIDGLSNDEIEALKEKAEELKERAEEIIEETEELAEEFKNNAEREKDEAIKMAENIKEERQTELDP